MKRPWPLALAACLGCGAPPAPKTPFAEAPACHAVGGLLDLHHAMQSTTTDVTGLRLLARIDEELAYLDAVRSPSPVELQPLRAQLTKRRSEVNIALERAAVTWSTLARLEPEDERLIAAMRRLDGRDSGSLRRTAAHLKTLPKEAGAGPWVTAMIEHADALQGLAELAAPYTDATRAPEPVRLQVEKEVDALRLRCLAAIDTTHRIEAGGSAPRAATVVVAPSVPESAEKLVGRPQSFGSGFVVQWRDDAGQRRLRIITNHHVMGGAREAEVRLSHHLDDGEAKPARARLLRSDPVDDLAVLEVVEGKDQVVGAGLRLRPDAPSERESVVAAGFPGVGRDPSYQVSEGVVSNARFGARKDDRDGVGAYIQHTAAIDPGNSGGPLLDKTGAVVGVNTLKLRGRENVGLAIPTPRIELALLRADDTPAFRLGHASAACQLAVAALTDPAPSFLEIDRLGVSLYDGREAAAGRSEASAYRGHLQGRPDGPVSILRAYAYAAVRAELDAVGGAVPFTPCQSLRPEGNTFAAKLLVNDGAPWKLTLATSRGQIRLVRIQRPSSGATH